MTGSGYLDRALHHVTDALARAGHCGRAARTAASISNLAVRARASAAVVGAWAADGRHDRATALIDQVRTASAPNTGSAQQCDVLLPLAGVAAAIGCHEQASSLFNQAVHTAGTLPDLEQRSRVITRLSAALARAGRCDWAISSARTISTPFQRAMALVEAASALAEIGEYDRAISTAHCVSDSVAQPYAFGWIVWHMAYRGNFNGAIELIQDIDSLGSTVWALVDVVRLTAYAGRTDDALGIAHAIADIGGRGRALAVIAEVLAAKGDHDRANTLLRTALLASPWRSTARTLTLLSPDLALEVHKPRRGAAEPAMPALDAHGETAPTRT